MKTKIKLILYEKIMLKFIYIFCLMLNKIFFIYSFYENQFLFKMIFSSRINNTILIHLFDSEEF